MDWVDHDGSVSVVFVADDRRKLDMLDALRESDANGSASKSTRARVVAWLAAPFILLGGCLTTLEHAPAAKALGFATMILLVMIVAVFQRAAKAPESPPSLDVRSTFTLRITRDALTLSNDDVVVAELPVADLADVVGGDYLELVRHDGARVRLPHMLPSHTNEVMATEIGARVREMRALGAYRG